jgi:hypothetical protein
VTLKFDEGRKDERVRLAWVREGAEAVAVRDGSTGAAKITTSALDGIIKALEAAR